MTEMSAEHPHTGRVRGDGRGTQKIRNNPPDGDRSGQNRRRSGDHPGRERCDFKPALQPTSAGTTFDESRSVSPMIDRFKTKAGTPKPKAQEKHRRILEKLGPEPHQSLRAMTDYGLSDEEIAKYYGISYASVRRLKSVLAVEDQARSRD